MINADWFWVPVGRLSIWLATLLGVGVMSGYVRLSIAGYDCGPLLLGLAGIGLAMLAVGAVVSGRYVVVTPARLIGMERDYDERCRSARDAAYDFERMVELGHVQSPGGLGAWEVASRTMGAEQIKVTFRMSELVPQGENHLIRPAKGYGHQGFLIEDAKKVEQLEAHFDDEGGGRKYGRAGRKPVWVMAVLSLSELLDEGTPLISQCWPMPHAALAAEFDWARY